MKNDRHYTPGAVAERLVGAARCRLVRAVADFAAGTGDLLLAGSRRWPTAKFIGIDTDRRALIQLRRASATWKSSRANFLNTRLVSTRLKRLRVSTVDLVLLNPPFSARRVKTVAVILPDNTKIKCGRAIAFVIESMRYCRNGGQILAILPSSSRNSIRDADAWRCLEAACDIRSLFALGHDTFPGCSARAHAFRFTVRRKIGGLAPNTTAPKRSPALQPDVLIIRGHVAMHKTQSTGKLRVVHSTDLIRNVYHPSGRFVDTGEVLQQRPVLLISRVGRPDHRKISMLEPANHCLSDCVIALVGKTNDITQAVRREILNDWVTFAALYQGTGAKYVGILQVGAFLAARGYSWNCESRQVSRLSIAEAQPNLSDNLVAFAG